MRAQPDGCAVRKETNLTQSLFADAHSKLTTAQDERVAALMNEARQGQTRLENGLTAICTSIQTQTVNVQQQTALLTTLLNRLAPPLPAHNPHHPYQSQFTPPRSQPPSINTGGMVVFGSHNTASFGNTHNNINECNNVMNVSGTPMPSTPSHSPPR